MREKIRHSNMSRSRPRGRWFRLLIVQALTCVVVLVFIQPSAQFTLVDRGPLVDPPPHSDAISVHGKLTASDNRHSQASHRYPPGSHQGPDDKRFSTSDRAQTSVPPWTHTQSAKLRKANSPVNFQPSHLLGKRPSEIIREPDAEASFNLKTSGSTSGRKSQRTQAALDNREGRPKSTNRASHSRGRHSSSAVDPRRAGVPFSSVLEVEWRGSSLDGVTVEHSVKRPQQQGQSPYRGGENSDSENSRPSASSPELLDTGHWLSLQQQVQQHTDDAHVSKMVLTAIGSLTAIVGVLVMAAIFQCCCRKRSSSPKEERNEQTRNTDRASRSRSASPRKVLANDDHEETVKEQSEEDKLLEEDEDLGDFSVVQRETEILRSYRKPPPPKNRARASRVPRALKTVDPNASPNIFQELVDKEDREAKAMSPKPANGLALSNNSAPVDMHSSMLDDIDSTLASMKTDGEEKPRSTLSPNKSSNHSREPSAEKILSTKMGSGSCSSLQPTAKGQLSASPSRDELAKSLALELSLSLSKEMLVKPQAKSPKGSKQSTPKSLSAGASPKVQSKLASVSLSKDSMGSNTSGNDNKVAEMSPEDRDKKEPSNFFALIDPTAKDNETSKHEKSKIPIRAASNPIHPATAQLRPDSGKEKRFPVPSVHGDQMDQLLKSLKTRLKDDDNAKSKTVSPEDDHSSEDLEPQGRDRSYSDPTKQQDDKETRFYQTHF